MSRSQLPPTYDSAPPLVRWVAWKGGSPSTRTALSGTMCLPPRTCGAQLLQTQLPTQLETTIVSGHAEAGTFGGS
jgi:hypothetical protein